MYLYGARRFHSGSGRGSGGAFLWNRLSAVPADQKICPCALLSSPSGKSCARFPTERPLPMERSRGSSPGREDLVGGKENIAQRREIMSGKLHYVVPFRAFACRVADCLLCYRLSGCEDFRHRGGNQSSAQTALPAYIYLKNAIMLCIPIRVCRSRAAGLVFVLWEKTASCIS